MNKIMKKCKINYLLSLNKMNELNNIFKTA